MPPPPFSVANPDQPYHPAPFTPLNMRGYYVGHIKGLLRNGFAELVDVSFRRAFECLGESHEHPGLGQSIAPQLERVFWAS